jgi:uncharacterized protein (TIGR02145 family)
MKKLLLILFLSLAAFQGKAQNLMEIYQNTGNILSIPMEAIDSVRFSGQPPTQLMRIFLNDQRIFSLKISGIDSIAYSLPPTQLLPEVLTLSLAGASTTSILAQGSVQNEGPSPVIRRGFCWSLQPLPSIINNHSEQGSGFGSFADTITPLEPGKLYFVRAYASNAAGTAYGEEFSISTASASSGNAPSVSTNAIQYTYESTALSGGNVTAAGSFSVTARGLCWATGTTPTLNHSFCVNGSGPGSYSSIIDQLMPEAVYKVRAWALSEAGVSYGEEKQFTFGRLAQLQTISASSVRSFSAIGGGKIINSMGPLRKKGICWGTNLYPVISKNQHSKDSTSSTDGFAAMMTGLQPGNTYYYRSYAQSTIGLSYGPVMKVKAAEPDLIVTDIDGNVYQADTIGSQIWMLENLRVTRLNNGTQLLHLPAVQSWYNNFEPGWCYYNNDSSNNLVYGKLYNYETMSVQTSTLSVCPTGWSMPLETDWTKLREFAGTKSALKLRASGGLSAGTGLWDDGLYNPGTDDFGFSALPGGYRQHSPQEFANESREANFWAYWDRRFKIIDYGMEVTSSSAQDYDGLSIRCIKKVTAGTIGALLCDSASFSGPLMHKRPAKNFSVLLPYTGGNGGSFTGRGEFNPILSTGVTGLKAVIKDGFFAVGKGSLRVIITGKPDTSGVAEFFISLGGQQCTLRCTVLPVPEGFMADQEGNLYPTVAIGNQVWMKKNLSTSVYRNGIPLSRPNWWSWDNTTEGGYCINNDLSPDLEVIENPLNDSLYGKLYNWYAVQDPRGLCPAGWKVPSKEDFDTLIQAAGGPDSANRKLKSTGNKIDGTGLWMVGCAGCPDGTDDLGFSALPGGYRLVGATYDYSSAGGNDARFWSTSTFTIPGFGLHAVTIALVAFPQIYQVSTYGGYSVNHGVSVRCIKE